MSGIRGFRWIRAVGLAAALLPVPAAARPSSAPVDRIQVLRTLVVAPGETVEDAICVGCGVVVRGRVRGDAIAILGGVFVEGESGRAAADDVIAIGGAVRIGPEAGVPASIVSVGGPVRIDPGAKASYDVDSLPWLHVPGQRRLYADGASSLVAFVLAVTAVGTLLVRGPGVAARDAALARAPLARILIGTAALAALACGLAAGDQLGRYADVTQSVLALVLVGVVVLGAPGVASILGRGVARLGGRRLAPGWRSAAVGALAMALLCLVPLVGAVVALLALVLACGGAVARRVTLTPSSIDEVRR